MPQRLLVRTVGEIMNRKPVTVPLHLAIGKLVDLFETERLDTVPVLEDDGVLRGIVGVLDVLRVLRAGGQSAASGRLLRSRWIETIMRPGAITVEATDPVPAAADLMIEARFHVLPVVRREERGPVLVGLLHQREVLAGLLQ
jgi:CBS domain-containing protein